MAEPWYPNYRPCEELFKPPLSEVRSVNPQTESGVLGQALKQPPKSRWKTETIHSMWCFLPMFCVEFVITYKENGGITAGSKDVRAHPQTTAETSDSQGQSLLCPLLVSSSVLVMSPSVHMKNYQVLLLRSWRVCACDKKWHPLKPS